MPNKKKGKSSKEYYDASPKSKAKKKAYDKKHGNTKKEQARRAKRNKARRAAVKAGKARKGDGKDVHHVGGNINGRTRVESRSKNRGRSEKSRKKGYKQKR